MILSDDHRFVFLHIPKCAGTAVRRQLEGFDTTDGRFTGMMDHAVLGRIYGTHVPLSVLRQHFPETFERVRTYRSFAIIRDPKERFRSALAQRLREVRGVEFAHAESELVASEAQAVVQELSKGEEMPPAAFIHFLPQHRWVELDGERITDELFPMHAVDRMFDALSAHIGKRVGEPARANETVEHRFPGLIKAARSTNKALREALPEAPYKAILNVAKPLLTKKNGDEAQPVPGGPEVEAFVERYYARDFEIADGLSGLSN
ncbi:sulfotransferase family 2 domain-containing protein [Parvularcula lutaonensis]|uniref:Sulfotransferase family 2 domain-containing protein n=1 Tax=Parvularcula lutaonensis TaxID=491923 RepID=A0ABV7M9A6_9PROT|nr:sulfotransferase family 2 domain-containing protein [Parvularcula lutaonensis]GGY41853.1 hypothetical protein GCM10007148_08090 [Parvularcula lutaonensis]